MCAPDRWPSLQAAATRRLLDRELTPEIPGYLSLVLLAEVVRVLVPVYHAKRGTVVRVVKGLLGALQLRVQEAEAVCLAMLDYCEAAFKADFSDALIARLGTLNGCGSWRALPHDRLNTQ